MNHLLAWRLPARTGRDKTKNREVDAACLRLSGPTRSRADSAWPEVRATGPDYPNAKATQANPQVSAEGVAQLDGVMLGAPIDRAGRAQTPYAYAGFPSPSGRTDDLSVARAGFRPARATDRRAEDEMRARPADPGCVWTARAPISLHLLRAANPRASSLSFICQWLMKSRTNVEPKWSSRRGSNPHAATTSRRTVGARVLRVSRSGTVQFTVQPHAFLFIRVTAKAKCHWPKSSLSNVVLVMPTAISPALPDRRTLWRSAFVAHGSTRFCIGSTSVTCRPGMSSVLHHGTLIKSVRVSFRARPSRTACAFNSRHLRAASVRFFW